MAKINSITFMQNFNFYSWSKCKRQIDGVLYNSYIFKLCKPLTTEQKTMLKNKYSNIEFLKGHAQYAPELKFEAVFIANSKSKGE